MSTISIERIRHLNGKEKPPAFAEVEKTIDKIQPRAFSLFERRGECPGLDWEDSPWEALCRQFGLPSPIDVSSVSASLDKGVLNVIALKAAKSSVK